MASRAVAFLLVALCLGLAKAAPCIRCEDCKGSDHCLSLCSRTCPQTVDLEKCKRLGEAAGFRVAKDSCDTTLTYCNGGQQIAAFAVKTQVTLEQCGNAAFGECQRVAKDARNGPCGSAFNGFKQCTKNSFQSFYFGEVDSRCNTEANTIQNNLAGR